MWLLGMRERILEEREGGAFFNTLPHRLLSLNADLATMPGCFPLAALSSSFFNLSYSSSASPLLVPTEEVQDGYLI